jgi:hypothetical protein
VKRISEAELGRLALRWHLSDQAVAVLASDNAWQQRARLLQIHWARELSEGGDAPAFNTAHPWKIAHTEDAPYLGDANFLSETIADEVRRALAPQPGQPDQVMEPVRLRTNLLSSQPLCFNAFGEFSAPGRQREATAILGRLWPDLVGRVTGIRYEHNPHRGAEGLTGTESAFDVFVDCVTPEGELAFVGIEVKYHESMNDTAPAKEAKREEIRGPRLLALERSAQRVGRDLDELLTNQPGERKVWQVWMDHSLALAMLNTEIQDAHSCIPAYSRGAFVMLFPEHNIQVQGSYNRYKELLKGSDVREDTLRFCTLEQFQKTCLEVLPDAPWVSDLNRRYLDTALVDALL